MSSVDGTLRWLGVTKLVQWNHVSAQIRLGQTQEETALAVETS